MKRALTLFIVMAFALLLAGCNRGDVSNVDRNIVDSELYTEAEIHEAMAAVERYFQANFPGCTLRELTYDEQFSIERGGSTYAERNEAERSLVLTSVFDVGGSDLGGGLSANKTVSTGWTWRLTQNDGEGWILQGCGYG